MTMTGGGPLVDWAALAPHIVHPTRESIVEAIRRIDMPLSAPDLEGVFEDLELRLAYIAHHVRALVGEEVLIEFGERSVGASIEKLYLLKFPG
jgi:hypothetical protein